MTNKQITIFVGVVIHDGKVLLNRRNEEEQPGAHGKWEFPGGKVEFGETPQEAVVRELKEETGADVEIVRLLPYAGVSYWDYEWGRQQTIGLAFLCKLMRENKRQPDHHVMETRWFPIAEAKELDGLPGLKRILEIAEREVTQ